VCRSASRSVGLFCASILSLLFIVLGYGSAEAAFHRVPGDASTIQGAIDMASAGDTVAVAGGTYQEHIVVTKNLVLLGGWNAGFTARDPAANVTIVDGQDMEPQTLRFAVGLGKATVLDGFTITNGLATQSLGFLGGAIYCSAASPTITNNVISSSRANFGAGIAVIDGAAPDIIGNEITGNIEIQTSGIAGCGIFCLNADPLIVNNHIYSNKGSGIRCDKSAPTIENNVIEGNTHGAGIACLESSDATVRYNVIRDNRATWGGGLWIEDSSPTIQYNMIRENTIEVINEQGGGAGLASFGDFGSPVISDNFFEDNFTTTDGGAIIVMGSATPTIERNLFKDNSTFQGGGAVLVQDLASAVVRSNTFYRNRATRGGTILVRQNASATLSRNIIFGSPMGGGIRVDYPATVLLDCNCVSNNLPSGYIGISPGPTDIQSNPIFCRTDGDTLDLAYNSPCLPGASPCGELIGAFAEGTCGAFPSNLSLLEPENGATLNYDTPTFRWQESVDPDGGSIYYKFEYDVDPAFETSIVVNTGSDTAYTLTPTEALDEGVTYYWHVTAFDEQENSTRSDQIWRLVVDKTPPDMTLGVHQHPYLDSYLDFYVVFDEEISGVPDASLTLDGSTQSIDLALLDPDEMVYYAPFEITSSATAVLEVSADDLAGNSAQDSETFSLEVLRPGAGSVFNSYDGGLTVSVEERTFAGAAYFLVKNLGEAAHEAGYPGGPAGDVQPDLGSDGAGAQARHGPAYSVSWSPSAPASPVKLTFNGWADGDGEDVSIFKWSGTAWEPAPTYRDPETGDFFTLTSRPGTFQIRGESGSTAGHTTVLFQNFPNPFRGATTVTFTVGGGGGARAVSVKVFDVSGRLVKSLLDASLEPGPYAITWDGTDSNGSRCPSGLYLYMLDIKGEGKTGRKMILTR
jgi:hypothetical protein